jgi:hypothetical protein
MAEVDRDELHVLVENIPERDVSAAVKMLRGLMDPVELAVLTAPVDDEPETAEERNAVEASLADTAPDIPFEQIRRVHA